MERLADQRCQLLPGARAIADVYGRRRWALAENNARIVEQCTSLEGLLCFSCIAF